MDQKLYLERFNAIAKEPTLENLTELQTLHLQAIPFENLDVIRRVPIYLNLTSIYDKLVKYRRGGYCYELNGLFQTLLCKLGYDAHLIAATVLRPNGQWAKAHTHAVILVHLNNERYLVDVGFGSATPRIPIPLNGHIQEDVGATFNITQHDDNFFDLNRTTSTSERTLYRFSTVRKNLLDFHEGCVFNQVAAESTFTHMDIVTRTTASGRITLTDFELKEIDGQAVTTRLLSSSEKDEILQTAFGIYLNN